MWQFLQLHWGHATPRKNEGGVWTALKLLPMFTIVCPAIGTLNASRDHTVRKTCLIRIRRGHPTLSLLTPLLYPSVPLSVTLCTRFVGRGVVLTSEWKGEGAHVGLWINRTEGQGGVGERGTRVGRLGWPWAQDDTF